MARLLAAVAEQEVSSNSTIELGTSVRIVALSTAATHHLVMTTIPDVAVGLAVRAVKSNGSGGIRTHASEETGALNQFPVCK